MAQTLAELTVDINARFDEVNAALNQLKGNCEKAQSGFQALSTGAISMSFMAAQQIIQDIMRVGEQMGEVAAKAEEYGHSIAVASQTLSMSTTDVQKFGYALQMEGGSIDQLIPAVKFMSNSLLTLNDASGKANAGSSLLKNGLDRLGIDAQQFSLMPVAEQLDTVFRKIGDVTNANDRVTITTEIFGRGAANLIPVMQNWSKEQDKLNGMLKQFGLTDSQIKNLDDLKSESNLIGIAMQSTGAIITSDLKPAIMELMSEGVKLAHDFSDFIKNNPEVIKSFEEIVDVVVKLTEALAWLLAKTEEVVTMPGTAAAAVNNAIYGMANGPGLQLAPGVAQRAASQQGAAKIPGYATGGIAWNPQLAMVGENGPEAITPIGQAGGIGSSLTVNVGNYMGDEISKRGLVRDLQRILNEENRRRVHPPTETNYYSVGGHL
ncbi:MAG: hypothetical protein ABSG90_12265 [Dehalococcoidia bacterium]|jgi:hypothetical protein